MASKLLLKGENLSIADIVNIVNDPDVKVGISSSALTKIKKSREILEAHIESEIIYGVNTGFGPMASHLIGKTQLLELQRNLIRSHATGVGKPMDNSFVLAAMVVRMNTLVKGSSGVSLELLERLEFFINHRIIPIIPEHGAVGTSGDLVQLAHIALAIMGEGKVFYKNKIVDTKKVLHLLNLKPYQFKTKEGLSMINGTSVMSAISAILCNKAEKLIALSLRTGALSLELVSGYKDYISPQLQSARPHVGQIEVAKHLRNILSSSKLLLDRSSLNKTQKINDEVHEISEEVQSVYSIRCIPQIVGPILDTVNKTKSVIEIEINSVTDNPIIDIESEEFIHGGNFHGDYISSSIDYLKIAIIKLTMLSERRINFFLHAKINEKFPPFMNLRKPGLTLGLQGLQFVATSTTAQSQTIAFPQYIHSIPTNADNQDIVSMGTDAALYAEKAIKNAFVVLAIEIATLCQGVDYAEIEAELSKGTHALFKETRNIVAKVVDDRPLSEEINTLVDFLEN